MALFKKIAAVILTASVGLTAACSGSAEPTPSDVPTVDAAKESKITVWSWDGTVAEAVPSFNEKFPNIEVEVLNVGSSMDEYRALDNAIQAGTGVPDLVMFEYFVVPYFAIPGKLADLTELGVKELEGEFVASAWNNVTVGDGIYALPSDYGPAAMFYNEATLKEAGVEGVPQTWDEYYEAAKKVRALGGDHYIMNDTGDPFLLSALIWQAGGQPFKVDGDKVTVNFDDEISQNVIAFWQKMIDEDLVNITIPNWSDEWNRTLNDGSLVTQIIGGWLTSTLPERAPESAGDWRVALMPQWNEGEEKGAENGGSSFGIPAAAQNKAEAYEFLKHFTHGEGLDIRVDKGAFVANTRILEDETYLSKTNEFFGDQEYNRVLAKAATVSGTNWQFPPFFEWARSAYADTSMPLYVERSKTLAEVVDDWAQQMITYGNEQGFTVSE